MEWRRADGYYYSTNDRFEIIQATDRIHNGDWELTDIQTKQKYYGYSLKHAKKLAEDISK